MRLPLRTLLVIGYGFWLSCNANGTALPCEGSFSRQYALGWQDGQFIASTYWQVAFESKCDSFFPFIHQISQEFFSPPPPTEAENYCRYRGLRKGTAQVARTLVIHCQIPYSTLNGKSLNLTEENEPLL